MNNSKRARSWKRRIQPRVGLKVVDPVLYSTHHLVEQIVAEHAITRDVNLLRLP